MKNRAVKIVLYVLIGLVGAAAIGVGVLYWLVRTPPAGYRPPVVTQAERERHARRFVSVIQDFVNQAEDVKGFEITITQDEANGYFASIETIVDYVAESLPGPRPERPGMPLLNKVGIHGVVAVMRDGRLTLMAWVPEPDKVVSADLAFVFDADGRLRVSVTDARVGRVSLPESRVQRAISDAKARVLREATAESAPIRAGGPLPTPQEVGRFMSAAISAVEGEPIMPIFGHRKDRWVQLTRIEIGSGKMTLGFVPYGRKGGKVVSRPAD